jgi:hypothetical protein
MPAKTSCIATILSANYLAYASVLAASIKQYEPSVEFQILIVDRATEEVRQAAAKSGLPHVFAEDLGIPDFEHLAFKFDVVEFNTALKPTFLKSLLARFERVVYLDPDIRIFSNLEPIWAALDEASIVLTPHSLQPIMDGARPSDIDFLRNGTFNLGFIGFKNSETSLSMLQWWEARCLSYGFNDTGLGVFVDQKWIDLVPCYYSDVKIIRDPGCNVAYWNLHERSITGDIEGFLINGKKLRFFHFSGVKANDSTILSKHQTRHAIQPESPLATLVKDYCKQLLNAKHLEFSHLPYTFGYFDNGEPIPSLARRSACFLLDCTPGPFRSDGPLYKTIRSAGLLNAGNHASLRSNTLTFDENSRTVRLALAATRTLSIIMGPARLYALCKYFSLLTKESNFTRVLLRYSFDFAHHAKKSRP